jgi:hypothetical protein
LANAIPLDLGVGDLDKVIWLGFSDGYLESNQGDRGDIPYCILVVFSTISIQPNPNQTKLNQGRKRQTKANKVKRKPTKSNGGEKRQTKANKGKRRQTKSNLGGKNHHRTNANKVKQRRKKLNKSKQEKETLRVVYGANHRAGQLGETGPPWFLS